MHKRYWLLVVLILLMSTGLLWAGGQKAPLKLVRFQTTETDPASLERYAEAEKRFEAMNPKLNVQIEPLPTMDDEEKAILAMAAGIQPGCSTMNSSVVAVFADKGWLVPLDGMVAEIGAGSFVPNALSKHTDGKYYWVPYAADSPFVWARKDLMDKKGVGVPNTGEEWLRAAQVLTEGKTYGMALPLARTSAVEYFITPFIWAAGSSLFDKDLNVTIDTEATRRAFSFVKAMSKYCPPAATEYSYGELINVFVSEQCAMSPYAGRTLSRILANNPALVDKSIVFSYPKDKLKATFIDWNSYSVFADTDVIEESKAWLQFLLSDEDFIIDFLLSVPGHLIPPQKGMLQNPKFIGADVIQQNKDKIDVLFGSPEYAIQYYWESGAIQNGKKVAGGLGTFNPVIGSIWAEALTGKYIQQYVIEGKNLDQVVRDFHDEVSKITADMLKK